MAIFALHGLVALRSQVLIELVLAGKALDIVVAIPTRAIPSSFLLVNRSEISVMAGKKILP
jgi:hypothetical protein